MNHPNGTSSCHCRLASHPRPLRPYDRDPIPPDYLKGRGGGWCLGIPPTPSPGYRASEASPVGAKRRARAKRPARAKRGRGCKVHSTQAYSVHKQTTKTDHRQYAHQNTMYPRRRGEPQNPGTVLSMYQNIMYQGGSPFPSWYTVNGVHPDPQSRSHCIVSLCNVPLLRGLRQQR